MTRCGRSKRRKESKSSKISHLWITQTSTSSSRIISRGIESKPTKRSCRQIWRIRQMLSLSCSRLTSPMLQVALLWAVLTLRNTSFKVAQTGSKKLSIKGFAQTWKFRKENWKIANGAVPSHLKKTIDDNYRLTTKQQNSISLISLILSTTHLI